jgi:hypothetical protein
MGNDSPCDGVLRSRLDRRCVSKDGVWRRVGQRQDAGDFQLASRERARLVERDHPNPGQTLQVHAAFYEDAIPRSSRECGDD